MFSNPLIFLQAPASTLVLPNATWIPFVRTSFTNELFPEPETPVDPEPETPVEPETPEEPETSVEPETPEEIPQSEEGLIN